MAGKVMAKKEESSEAAIRISSVYLFTEGGGHHLFMRPLSSFEGVGSPRSCAHRPLDTLALLAEGILVVHSSRGEGELVWAL